MFERVGLLHMCLHIHLFLNFADKYTDIYDVLGLLGLEGPVVVEGGSTLYPSASLPEFH